jgi:hypothetical protein
MPMIRFLCLSLLLSLAACTPSGSESTPGPTAAGGQAVIVTDHFYDAGVFRVRTPSGWRIVTGPADVPPKVTFVSPDNRSVITLSAGAVDAPTPTADVRAETRQVAVNEKTLTAVGSAPTSEWGSFLPLFDEILASVQPG